MKRWLLAAAVVVAFSLMAAGTAAATVTFDAGSGFIGRGDVIAYLGKSALVEHPTVIVSVSWQAAGTCVFGDGTRVAGVDSFVMAAGYVAEARHAPGNDSITGYTFGPEDATWSLAGGGLTCDRYPESWNSLTFEVGALLSYTIHLTFQGTELPVAAP